MKFDVYTICVALHVLAFMLWIGHMVFGSLVLGPLAKRMQPPEDGEALRTAITRRGGLGWPALAVLVATGIVFLQLRGAFTSEGFDELYSSPGGQLLAIKCVLVAGMIAYQWRVGHRPAPKLVYLNMLAAFAIAALSLLFVRHPDLLLLPGIG